MTGPKARDRLLTKIACSLAASGGRVTELSSLDDNDEGGIVHTSHAALLEQVGRPAAEATRHDSRHSMRALPWRRREPVCDTTPPSHTCTAQAQALALALASKLQQLDGWGAAGGNATSAPRWAPTQTPSPRQPLVALALPRSTAYVTAALACCMAG